MARTYSQDKPIKYFIAYGFVGGALNGIRMRHLLKKAGYVKSRSINEADIVIAHSAGCWDLAGSAQAKLVLLVGLPMAKVSVKVSSYNSKQMYRTALKNHHYLHAINVRILAIIYFLLQPKRNYRIIRYTSRFQTEFVPPKGPGIVCIVNQYDPWPTGSLMQEYIDREDWAFIGMSGSHDDLWEHPSRYVEIIDHYAGLLG